MTEEKNKNRNKFKNLRIFLSSFFLAFSIFILIRLPNHPEKFKEIIAIAPIFLITAIVTMIFDGRIKEIAWGNFKIIKELENKVEDLTGLITYTLKTTLKIIEYSAFFDGMPENERQKIKKEIKHLMNEYKLEEKKDDIFEGSHATTHINYCNLIVNQPWPIKHLENTEHKLHEYTNTWHGATPSPEELKIKSNEMEITLTETREELLKDYKHYFTNKEHRRPKIWNNKNNIKKKAY